MRFQHGVWERPDPVGDLGDGQGRVALEQVEDLAVDQVHGDSSRSGRDPAPSFSSACASKLAREGKKRRKVSAGGRGPFIPSLLGFVRVSASALHVRFSKGTGARTSAPRYSRSRTCSGRMPQRARAFLSPPGAESLSLRTRSLPAYP